MQIIKISERNKYLCPMKFSSGFSHTEAICEGPKCMWWSYSFITDYSTFPDEPKSEIDLTSGYCSH
jgi:hypothetical protein